MVFRPMQCEFDPATLQMANAPVFAATSTDYGPFAENGGKIIIWHGTADPAFSTEHLVNWYEGMQEANDGAEFARLYLVPRMHHCSGDGEMESFDALTPLIDWVENGEAPGEIVATGAPEGEMADVSRPLCPHPQYPTLTGEDRDSAASYECVMP